MSSCFSNIPVMTGTVVSYIQVCCAYLCSSQFPVSSSIKQTSFHFVFGYELHDVIPLAALHVSSATCVASG